MSGTNEPLVLTRIDLAPLPILKFKVSLKRFVSHLHYSQDEFETISKEPPMPATTDVPDATDHQRPINKKSPVGNWEIHSWGHGAFPGMAILSAITTLQVGAT